MEKINNALNRWVGVASTALLATVVMAGCGKKESEKHATQTAVSVNGAEITVHQVNYLLRQSGDKAKDPAAPRQALDTLINQELLVQKAVENHLDRDTDVLQTLENARREILSQAYLQRLVLPHTPIAEQEMKDFFQKNPDLFEKRRIFQLQIFTLEQPKLDTAVNAALDQAQTPEKVRELLKEKQITFQEETVAKAAEQLPLEMLPPFAKAKIGDIIVVPQAAGKAVLMQVVNLAERPLSWEQAKTQIEQFLTNQRNRQALETHLKQLRATTEIEYLGDFATQSQPTALPAQGDNLSQPSPPPAAASVDRQYLEKGLSGLKK